MLPDGLLSFPLTPFTADDRLDLAAYREHLDQQLAGGPGALFVACGTGEFGALSPGEYREVVGAAVATVAGRVPVYAGAGGGPALAREFAVAAAESGADGLLLLPPYLVTSPPTGYLRHVEHVAKGTDLPLIVYQRANARLSPATAVALLDLPTVVGIKDGIGDVDAFLRIVTAVRASGHPRADAFGFLNGLPTAELSAQAYRAIGVPSYSSAAYCFAPRIALAFHAAVHADDTATTQRLIAEFYGPFAELRDEVPGYAVSLVKAGARLGGLDLGGVRPPLLDPTDAHLARLAEILDNGHKAVS
ncbi:5-dehydro-4-deoxyglucarate dehydratase [Longispora sp. NPDC051575]|uniref:5-dehydro-4-deoxyglucarate dehydratase n=1 Tax=Longispora sp. NPDC051575 TaxID=3154943 RepID=UPI003424CBA5